jgi:hypothetical protein
LAHDYLLIGYDPYAITETNFGHPNHWINTETEGNTPDWLHYTQAGAKGVTDLLYAEDAAGLAPAGVPTVATAAATAVGDTHATIGGEVTADGGADVTETGVYIGVTPNPVADGTKVAIGAGGVGTFGVTRTGLGAGQTYYICAYAINSVGESVGAVRSFATDNGDGGLPAGVKVMLLNQHRGGRRR